MLVDWAPGRAAGFDRPGRELLALAMILPCHRSSRCSANDCYPTHALGGPDMAELNEWMAECSRTASWPGITPAPSRFHLLNNVALQLDPTIE